MASISTRFSWAIAHLGVKPGDAVLELGCGRGEAAAILLDQCAPGKLLCIDRSATAIAAARERNARSLNDEAVAFMHASITDAIPVWGSFDCVFAINVNVFWLDGEAEFAAVRNLLKPAGSLWLFYEPPSKERGAEVVVRLRAEVLRAGFVASEVLEEDAGGHMLIGMRTVPGDASAEPAGG